MAVSSLEAEMNAALEEFTQKLRRLADAHIAASHAELSSRERALDERERHLIERERAASDRAKAIAKQNVLEQEFARQDALEQTKAEEAGDNDQAMLKSTQPERAKAALMVPSPTRARSNIPPTPPPSSKLPLRTAPALPCASPSPRTRTPSNTPIPPCSPPVATTVSLQTARESPQSEEGGSAYKVTALAERKEKLLVALNSGGFQANSSLGDQSFDASMVSTPGRQVGRGSSVGVSAKQTRRSLADLLEEDQVRMAQSVRSCNPY